MNEVVSCGPAQILQLKGKGQRNPSTVEEMRAQLDRDMAAAHEEEKRCIQFCALSSLSHHSAYELFEVYSNHFITCLQVVQGQPLPRSSILKLCGWNDHWRFILGTKVLHAHFINTLLYMGI